MNKLIVAFIILFFSFNLQGQSFDNVEGLYIGEMHRNPVNAQKFIAEYKSGSMPSQNSDSLFSFLGKKVSYFYVTQNDFGLHLIYVERRKKFAAMPLNARGEFNGKLHKHTIEGFFDGDLFSCLI